jgi:triacylglycerol lipase
MGAVTKTIASALLLIVALAPGCSRSHAATVAPARVEAAATAPVQAALLSAPSAPAPTATARRCWPIVLVHGFAGWKKLGPVDYYWHVPKRLSGAGFEVLVTGTSPVNRIEPRARALAAQILAQYPDPHVKLNLIAHSMGGLDARYAISVLGLGPRVASLTTIGTPHRGTTVSDVVTGFVPGPAFTFSNFLFFRLGWDITCTEQLSSKYLRNTFNPVVQDDPAVAYFSYAGVADPLGMTGHLLEPELAATWWATKQREGANDGLISVASAKWGTFKGTIPADHWHEIGQPFGWTGHFDHEAFYEKVATDLEAAGFGP